VKARGKRLKLRKLTKNSLVV